MSAHACPACRAHAVRLPYAYRALHSPLSLCQPHTTPVLTGTRVGLRAARLRLCAARLRTRRFPCAVRLALLHGLGPLQPQHAPLRQSPRLLALGPWHRRRRQERRAQYCAWHAEPRAASSHRGRHIRGTGASVRRAYGPQLRGAPCSGRRARTDDVTLAGVAAPDAGWLRERGTSKYYVKYDTAVHMWYVAGCRSIRYSRRSR